MKILKKIILLSVLITSTLIADFKTLSTNEVKQAIKNGIAIIDIRRPDEYKQYGIIEGSYKLTFFNNHGEYNINKWLTKFTKIITSKNQPFILVCAHANRSKVVAKFLNKQLNYKNVNELDGGINYGWIDKGNKTIKIK
jgi:rhodanese-related sulfurtransferase